MHATHLDHAEAWLCAGGCCSSGRCRGSSFSRRRRHHHMLPMCDGQGARTCDSEMKRPRLPGVANHRPHHTSLHTLVKQALPSRRPARLRGRKDLGQPIAGGDRRSGSCWRPWAPCSFVGLEEQAVEGPLLCRAELAGQRRIALLRRACWGARRHYACQCAPLVRHGGLRGSDGRGPPRRQRRSPALPGQHRSSPSAAAHRQRWGGLR
jgi:hypothetical protein